MCVRLRVCIQTIATSIVPTSCCAVQFKINYFVWEFAKRTCSSHSLTHTHTCKQTHSTHLHACREENIRIYIEFRELFNPHLFFNKHDYVLTYVYLGFIIYMSKYVSLFARRILPTHTYTRTQSHNFVPQ